jgi:hypothetical protein
LAQDYVPGSGSVALVTATRALQEGVLMCVGLNTFYVVSVSSDQRTATVMASYEGGPDEAAASGSRVFLKPRATTFDIFRRLSDEIMALSTPRSGLFGTFTWSEQVDPTWQTYEFPAGALGATKVLEVTFREPGSADQWTRVRRWDEDEVGGARVLRVWDFVPAGVPLQITVALPFSRPTSLISTVEDCGLAETQADIPVLGTTAQLMASGEARRFNPSAQGDARRAEELTPGYSMSASREWSRMKADRIDEEHSRLLNRFPIMTRVT